MAFISKSQTGKKKLNRRTSRLAISQSLGRKILQTPPVSTPVSVPIANGHPLIFWIGQDYANLFDKGRLYGFTCKWFSGSDLSSVRHAKCLVASNVESTDKFSSCINFACEYGIPSIWVHKTLPPEVHYWSFSEYFHLNDSELFWRRLIENVILPR